MNHWPINHHLFGEFVLLKLNYHYFTSKGKHIYPYHANDAIFVLYYNIIYKVSWCMDTQHSVMINARRACARGLR